MNRFVSAISELRRRHLFQIAVVYVGVAWFFLEVTDFVVGNYDLSRRVIDVAVLLAALGFPAALVIGWFHGERGHQEMQRSELWILATLGILAAVGTYRIATGEEPVATDPGAPGIESAAPETGGRDAVVPAVGEAASDLGRGSVAIFPFESHVTDPELDWLGPGLADLLTTNLAQVPDLRVVARQQLFRLLREAGREEGEEIPQSIATSIAARSGARHMVWGSVVGAGDGLAIDAQLVELETGTVLAAERVRGEDVFTLVDTLSARLAGRLTPGPAPPAVRVAGGELGTRDLDAYGAFARGLRLERMGETEEAARLFERAAEHDSTFVLARVLAAASRAAATGVRAQAEAERRMALEELEGNEWLQRFDVRVLTHGEAHPESIAVRIDSVLAKLSSMRPFLPGDSGPLFAPGDSGRMFLPRDAGRPSPPDPRGDTAPADPPARGRDGPGRGPR